MKQVQRRRPLPPTFGALTSKMIVPNSLWISVPPLFPSLYSPYEKSFASSHSSWTDIGEVEIDEKLIKFFAIDFTKKTKTLWTVCPSINISDKRAESKLRLAVEHIKITISASPGAAICSVESLKDGMDYSGSINRMKFDMVVNDRWNTTLVSPRCTLRLTVCATPACYTIDVKAWGCSSNF